MKRRNLLIGLKLHLKARCRQEIGRQSSQFVSFSLALLHRKLRGEKERGTNVFPAVGGQRRNNESPSSGASTTGCFKTNGFWPPAVASLSLLFGPLFVPLVLSFVPGLLPAGCVYMRARWAIAIGPSWTRPLCLI